MRHLPRLIGSISLAASVALAPTVAGAQETTDTTIGGEGDNVAVAVNTKDGRSTFTVSFRIVRTSGDVVDQSNIAFAFSSCEECRTLAFAVQVVLVGGEPSTVIPENYAIALNFECTSCETLASAYQFVLGTDGNVHFTPEGNRAIAAIRRALYDLARSDLSLDEIQAELDLLADDLRTVLANELLAAGPPDLSVDGAQDATPAPGPSPSPNPSVTDGTSPAPTESPTTVETGTPSPAASASPEPSASPSPSQSASSSPSPSPAASVSP